MNEPMPQAVLDAEAIEEPGTALEPSQPSTLFRSDDPATVLQRAQATAEALMPVVRKQGLIAKIQGRDHLTVEAWQTLGAMLGVTPVCTWTRKLEDGWEARVEARTLDGRVIGAAEAECLRSESTWKSRDDFAIRSMAQTRATSKALASVLRFVATLAGFAGTPAEEMPGEPNDAAPRQGFVSDKQRNYFEQLLRDAKMNGPAIAEVVSYAREAMTGSRGGTIAKAIDALKDESTQRETAEKLLQAARAHHEKHSDVPFDEAGLP